MMRWKGGVHGCGFVFDAGMSRVLRVAAASSVPGIHGGVGGISRVLSVTAASSVPGVHGGVGRISRFLSVSAASSVAGDDTSNAAGRDGKCSVRG
eukprot:3934823-Rhodomonas_salina.1